MIKITLCNGYVIDLGQFDKWKCPIKEEQLSFMKSEPSKFIRLSDSHVSDIRMVNPNTGKFYSRVLASVPQADRDAIEYYSEDAGGISYRQMLIDCLSGKFIPSLELVEYLFRIVYWGHGDVVIGG